MLNKLRFECCYWWSSPEREGERFTGFGNNGDVSQSKCWVWLLCRLSGSVCFMAGQWPLQCINLTQLRQMKRGRDRPRSSVQCSHWPIDSPIEASTHHQKQTPNIRPNGPIVHLDPCWEKEFVYYFNSVLMPLPTLTFGVRLSCPMLPKGSGFIYLHLIQSVSSWKSLPPVDSDQQLPQCAPPSSLFMWTTWATKQTVCDKRGYELERTMKGLIMMNRSNYRWQSSLALLIILFACCWQMPLLCPTVAANGHRGSRPFDQNWPNCP